MSISRRIGGILQNRGTALIEKELEAMYGERIGQVANNGNKAFQRTVGKTTTTTGLTWDNKVIAEVKTTNHAPYASETRKIIRNKDGDIVEVSLSKRATNVRKNVRTNLETGEVESKILDTTGDNFQYQVTTTNLDKNGKVSSSVKDVKVKGKNSPLD